MKKLLILLFSLSLSLPASAQIINDTLIFFKITKTRGIDRGVMTSARGILDQNRKAFEQNQKGMIEDSLVFFTDRLERSVLSGKNAGKLTPEVVKKGQKLYPGRNSKAVIERLKFYAKETE